MLVKTSELRLKDVINVVDGRVLGYIYDVDVDPTTGEILAVILPGKGGGLRFFGRPPEIEIPWNHVVLVGVDVVLVRVPELSEPLELEA